MKRLKVQDTGSYLAGTYVKIDKTEYQISDDGKTADLILYNPLSFRLDGSAYLFPTSGDSGLHWLV